MQTRQKLPLRSLRWLYERSRRDSAKRHGCALLDIRPPEQTRIDHLPGSAQISTEGRRFDRGNLPSHLLPPPGNELALFAEDPERARRAASNLCDRGWNAAAVEAVPSPEYFLQGPSLNALWVPDPFVAAQLERLPPVDAGPIVDLGAGSGRDGVFLAQRGYDLLLVDRLPDALRLAEDRARRHGVVCRHEVADLRVPDSFSGSGFAAALAIRSSPRPMLARLHERMLPGGVLLLNDYGPAPVSPQSGPAAGKRLSIAVLTDLISAAHWEMLVGPQVREADGESWVQLIARQRHSQ